MDYKQITENMFTVNIEIALFGIRNLIKFAKRPTVILKLTNDPLNREIRIPIENGPVNTKNPNFGKIVVFEAVKMPFEPLLWP